MRLDGLDGEFIVGGLRENERCEKEGKGGEYANHLKWSDCVD